MIKTLTIPLAFLIAISCSPAKASDSIGDIPELEPVAEESIQPAQEEPVAVDIVPVEVPDESWSFTKAASKAWSSAWDACCGQSSEEASDEVGKQVDPVESAGPAPTESTQESEPTSSVPPDSPPQKTQLKIEEVPFETGATNLTDSVNIDKESYLFLVNHYNFLQKQMAETSERIDTFCYPVAN